MCWLGRQGSNLRMAASKAAALPLGDAPAWQSAALSEHSAQLEGVRRSGAPSYVDRHVFPAGLRSGDRATALLLGRARLRRW